VKFLRVLLLLLVIAGGCLTSRAVYLHAKAELAGVLIRRAWQELVKDGEPRPPWPWADTRPVARLRIPRLGYDEIVLDAATPRTLAFGPARLLSGAALGEPGNLVLAGHRTSWFRPIEALAAGDSIEIEWFDARRGRLLERTYTVNAIRVVLPQEVSLLAPTSADALTLITCYPFGRSPRAPQRFVVRASPAGPSRSAQISAVTQFPSTSFTHVLIAIHGHAFVEYLDH
jgi:sortase A